MEILLKPLSFLFIMFFSYYLKRRGIMKQEHGMVLMNVIMFATLPCAVMVSFAGADVSIKMLWLVLIGFSSTVLSYFVMYFLTRKVSRNKRIFYIIDSTGYNIGCYGIPVASAFYGPIGAVIGVMIDMGNSFMMIGGNYAFTSVLFPNEEETRTLTIKDVIQRFVKSVPFDTSMLLLFMLITGLRFPDNFITFITPIANANAFLAMFMLGTLFTPPSNKGQWKSAFCVLAFRCTVSTIFAIAVMMFLPFSAEIKHIAVIVLFSPIGALAPGFVERCKGDSETAAFTNTVSTIASLIIMTMLSYVFSIVG